MLLAIVDFIMPIFIGTMFNHAVRAGVRYAITYRVSSGMNHTQSIQKVVQANSAGFLSGSTGLSKIQVKFYSPSSFQQLTGSNANAGGNIVEVSISGYNWGWLAPIFRSGSPLAVSARSSDRLESLPRGVARPVP
jgi:hypothetical protein